MQDPAQLVSDYLAEQHMMQLATVNNGRPWCCSLYYVHDADKNLYWASFPTRRHSQEIENNPSVAVAIPIKHQKGQKVVGIQMEGHAKKLAPTPANRSIVEAYAHKFGRTEEWVNSFTAGENQHQLYRFTPASIVLFDDINSPDNPRVTL